MTEVAAVVALTKVGEALTEVIATAAVALTVVLATAAVVLTKVSEALMEAVVLLEQTDVFLPKSCMS